VVNEVTHRLVSLPVIRDARGALGFAQAGAQIPFEPRRVFYLYSVAAGASRGGHAHRAQHQFLIQLAGRCRVTVTDGSARHEIALENDAQGLYLPPMLWLDLDNFTPDAVCLVLASGVYDESDYIRDMAEFRRLTQ
jgi:dTDP-4-dehydrorhamnose 3,5-epimerase-like enzyme